MSDIVRLSRRRFLRNGAATAGTAALFSAVSASFAGGVFAQGRGPETTRAVLGFIALTDAAPLVVAREKGYFEKHGMPDVEVVKQSSWGTTRDNLVLGSDGSGIDGAHILTPMPYLMGAGKITQNGQPLAMAILARLNLDGQGISIGKAYGDLKVGLDASVLKEGFARKKAAGTPAKIAMTFPGGTHDLWIRYWLAAGGIDPDTDVETIVVPPPQMVANMKVGTMDAFCVGEPWNAQLVEQGIGTTALTTGELWARHPEKSFAMRADWVEKNPRASVALLMAIQDAAQWADDMANKDELAEMLGKRAWFNVKPADIGPRMKGTIDHGDGRVVEASPHFMKFWRDDASYPFRSHDAWFLTEEMRWGKLEATADVKAMVDGVNREDLWREAAKALGVAAIPASTSRGPETFFDGKVFDPADPAAYLASLAITRIA